MSTSVYHPLDITLVKSNKSFLHTNKVLPIKRNLFGTTETNNKFVADNLKMFQQTKSDIWNFDFTTEETLDPTGPYIWEKISTGFVGQFKRKLVDEDEDELVEIEEQYGHPDDLIRPEPIRPKVVNQEEQEMKVEKRRQPLQRSLKDYMSIRKRSAPSAFSSKKPQDRNSDNRPIKLARKTELS